MAKNPDPKLRLTNIWKVLKVGNIENPKDYKSGEALAFEFDASAKTYFGNAGCNTIRGAIKENDGERLLLGPGMSTMMACPNMEAENEIKQALEAARSYQIQSNTLSLQDSVGNTLMTFQAID
ncbi:META domain-containing protein [Algoriphagus halophytocola]|uniref:META domain-containing protein n=1 Tax=Algoriphagus halophytocola TaxID=2991499 RepID=UPI0022DE74BD|nr:META domain-containing protein [Algoriphagus sp. TR-M9]WBL44602.1 META domain-containing protein [Algoriphagus sp. TR-M9]